MVHAHVSGTFRGAVLLYARILAFLPYELPLVLKKYYYKIIFSYTLNNIIFVFIFLGRICFIKNPLTLILGTFMQCLGIILLSPSFDLDDAIH